MLQQAWNDVMGNESYLSLTENEISDHKDKDNEVSSLSDHELSFLWSRLNIQEQEEVSAGDDPSVIEELHDVTPQQQKNDIN